jgi:hypothetical protein
VKYSFENLFFTKKQRNSKPEPVKATVKPDHTDEYEGEALQLVNALLGSPYPAENDEISGFYSEVRLCSEKGVGSAAEWFDRITSNNK